MVKEKMTEPNISIDGDTALLYGWNQDSHPKRVDYSKHLSTIGQVITDLKNNDEPKIIGIQGAPGSGKTILSKVLEANGSNITLIDVDALSDVTQYSKKLDIRPLIKEYSKTCIIDEAGLVDFQSLEATIDMVTDSNGILLMLYQHERNLPNSVVDKIQVKQNLDQTTLE